MPAWGEIQKNLTDQGYTPDDLVQAQNLMRQKLSDQGYPTPEIDTYFGTPEPDMAPIKTLIGENFKKAQTKTSGTEGQSPEVADSFLDAIEAGLEISTTGLFIRGKKPDTVLPEHAPMAYNILAQAGTLIGDIPAMVAGFGGGSVVGGAAGTFAAPGPGTVLGGAIGAGAGAFALPAALRETLMQHYEKGDIQDFSDFWERTSAVFLAATKAGITGAATAGVGSAIGALGGKVISQAITPAAQIMSEVATMTTVGKVLEGEVPKAEDFLEAAILVGGLHGVGKVSSVFRNVYSKAGLKPSEIALQAINDPVLKQELNASNVEFPNQLKDQLQVPLPGKEQVTVSPEFTKQVEGFSDGKNTEVKIDAEKTIEKPAEATPPDTPEARVKAKISFDHKEKSIFSVDKFYADRVDDLHPVNVLAEILSGKKISERSAETDPYKLLRLTRGDFGKADQIIERGVGNSPGLKEILSPIKNEIEDFEVYAVSKRALEQQAKGLETGINPEDAAAVVKNGEAKFEKVFRQTNEFQNEMINQLKESGVLSQESFNLITEANKDYVPFFRLTEEGTLSRAGGKGFKVRQPIKNFKGSNADIISPLESIIKNTYLYVKLSERNIALNKLIDLNEQAPEGLKNTLIEKVPTEFKAIKISDQEISKFLDEHGIDSKSQDALDVMTIFRPKSVGLRPDEIAVFRKGKREVYRVPEDVADSINGADQVQVEALIKFLAVPAKLLRAGVTIAPDFAARNFFRDQFSASVFSSGGYVPVYDALKGLGSVFKKDEVYQKWLANGGANATAVALDRAYIKTKVFKLGEETGFLKQTWNLVKSPIEFARVYSEVMENATRVGLFKKALEAGATEKEAAFQSREGTVDFQRIGSKMRALNMITAFMNVGIQGTDRTIRGFKDNPGPTFAKVAAGITLPSVLLWYANHDDPRWKEEINDWEKDLFWIVMTDKHIYRLPKPFELGILFGSLPERILDIFFTDNPDQLESFKSLMQTSFGGLTPAYIPTFAVPIIETWANKNTFTGRSIIPSDKEKGLPEYQYKPYTSEVAKGLGSLISSVPGGKFLDVAAPAVIDNWIRAWSGTLGQYAVSLADRALTASGVVPDPILPAAALEELPIVKSFMIRHPSANAKSIQRFYDRSEKIGKILFSIKDQAKEGNLDEVQKLMKYAQDNGQFAQVSGIREGLSNINKTIRLITKNPEIKPDEKRQQIDGLYNTMLGLAHEGNKLLNEIEKGAKP